MSDLIASPAAAVARPAARLSDVRTMIARSVRLNTRNVDALLTSVILPVLIMLLFVYLFGGAIETARPSTSTTLCRVCSCCARGSFRP